MRLPGSLRVAREYLRLGLLNELQYRVNFFVQLGQSLIAVGTGLLALSLVFQQTDQLAGWSRDALLAVMGVHVLVGGLVQMLIQPNMARLVEDVRQGSLDHLLCKPEDAQVLASLREFRLWQGVDLLVGGGLLGYALSRMGGALGPTRLLAFAALLILGLSMIYAVWLILACSAFWIVRSGDMLEMFSSVYQAGRWPVTVYPGWLRNLLTFIVPVAFAVTLPAQAFTGPPSAARLVLAGWLATILWLLARAMWQAGLRRYSGASA